MLESFFYIQIHFINGFVVPSRNSRMALQQCLESFILINPFLIYILDRPLFAGEYFSSFSIQELGFVVKYSAIFYDNCIYQEFNEL